MTKYYRFEERKPIPEDTQSLLKKNVVGCFPVNKNEIPIGLDTRTYMRQDGNKLWDETETVLRVLVLEWES